MELTGPVVGFDLDMTLVDSAEGIVATFVAAAEQVSGGTLTLTRDLVWPFIGVPLEVAVEALAGDNDPDLLIKAYRALYLEIGVPLTRLIAGADDALAAVRAEAGRILVISAKRQAAVEAVMRQIGLGSGDLAPDVVVGDLYASAKGERLLAESADIYVGDHTGDIVAGKVGRCTSVGVATGPTSAEQLEAAGADVVLPDLRSFPSWLHDWVRPRGNGSVPG